jgi:hypothetical protein
MSLPSSTSTAATHAPRDYLLKPSVKHQTALDNAWKALDGFEASNCDALERAYETAWEASQEEYKRVTKGLSTHNWYELQVIVNMESIPIALSEVSWESGNQKVGEAPGDRAERIRKAGQKAKRKVEEILKIEEPDFERAEKASTGADTGADPSSERTEKSGNTDPSIQTTDESGNTHQSGNPANLPVISIHDLLGGTPLM